jgi:N-acyl-L-homoserine lactone synthetase
MNVLSQIKLASGLYTCREISRFNSELLRQFWARRTLWTERDRALPKADTDTMYDESSSYIVLTRGTSGTVIAGCRIIHEDDARQLPVNGAAYRPISGKGVQVTRFFLPTNQEVGRAEMEQVLACLLKGVASFLLSNRYYKAYASIRANRCERLAHIGLSMQRIGRDKGEGAKAFVPVAINVLETSGKLNQPKSQLKLAA